ncbi:MAG: hypothetical protein J6Q22_17990 [Prevotella sp.]|nr:hypothetical protein [Prevotella sp.]
MARKGSPGVAIKIEDRSGYSFIENPALIGGVVGYSPKGEFNKILKITNTANQDSILGLGFNQPKWNMGMYATRAVLNNGGHVHFVRPYGEQVDKTDVRKSDLKSDAFVVCFDRNASKSDYYDKSRTAEENETDVVHTSFDIRHFAATRYIADGFAGFGGKRKINTTQETIAENSNVDFQLTAGEEFNEEGKVSDVRSDTNMVLFAIVNSDPTAAKRAADRYTATVRKNSDSANKRLVTLVCDSVPAFTVGDVIYFPASNFVESEKGVYATVNKILDTQVVAEYEAEMDNVPTMATKTATFFCNNDDATTGVDYLEVKTAVANRAVKKYGEMNYAKTSGKVDFSNFKMGDAILLREPDGAAKITRVIGLTTVETVSLTLDDKRKTFSFVPTEAVLEAGDSVTFFYEVTSTVDGQEVTTTKSIKGTVDSVTVDNEVTVTLDAALEAGISSFTSYEITSVGKESCDASAKIVTLNVNSNRPLVLNPVDTSKLSWDDTTPAKLVGKFDTEAAAKAFMTSINGEDTVVATFEGADKPEEYVGVNVSGPTAIEDAEATTKTSNGTFTISSFTPATEEGGVTTPATATGTVTWTNTDVPAGTAPTSTKGTFAQGTDGKWTLTYADAPSTTPQTETVVSESYSVKETHYYVSLVFPEVLPKKPSTLKTRGMVDVGTVSADDIIKLVSTGEEYYVTSVSGSGAIAITGKNGEAVDGATSLGDKIINLTATTNNILAAFNREGFAINTYLGNNVTQITDAADKTKYNTTTTIGVQVPFGTATQYGIGDLVAFVPQKTNKAADGAVIFSKNDIYEVKNINTFKDIVVLSHSGDINFDRDTGLADKFGTNSEWKLVDLTASNANIWVAGKDGLTFNMLGAYDLTVPANVQEEDFLIPSDTPANDLLSFAYTNYNGGVVQRTDKLLVSDDVGASFNAMGLASVKYEDVNFNGEAKQVYVLSSEGEAIARMYLYITYHFNGKSYDMEGTIVPYVHDDGNLYIGDVADSVLTDSGARLLINDSGILDNFLTNNAYDMSQSVENGHLDSVSTMLSYDERDPAIIYDAIWEYSPANNSDTATLANAWNLFLDKDGTDVSMLIGAGTGVKNLFKKNRETLDGTVISAILNVCELRKDCFAILDGVGEASIETTLRKMIGAQGFGVKGRWGAIYDGRGVFFDSYYTLMNVEVVKSVQLASIITANAANGIWWLPPAGEINAVIPTEWGVTEKYPRTFKYPEDTDSNIARLTEIRVNPTRFNSRGMFVWGDFTMQKESSAFDQIHVAMLLAGIHKMFYHYLDRKVFQLNTTNLRTNIQSDLQAQLDAIMNSNPAGLYSGTAICDDTNNTPDVIDRNELHVDLRLKPTKTSRWITLRTIVESNGSSNTQSTSLYV